MQSLGIIDETSSMTPLEQDTILSFSDESLSTYWYELGLKIGKRFAQKVGKEVELYQAEALYLLTVLCKDEQSRTLSITSETTGDRELVPITTETLVIRKIYRGLYEYYYADRVVSASRMTVWRNEKEGKHVVTTSSLTVQPDSTSLNDGGGGQHDLEDKRVTDAQLLETFDAVARSAGEREYLYLKLQGANEDEIAANMGICERVVNDIRARITKRLKKHARNNQGE